MRMNIGEHTGTYIPAQDFCLPDFDMKNLSHYYTHNTTNQLMQCSTQPSYLHHSLSLIKSLLLNN